MKFLVVLSFCFVVSFAKPSTELRELNDVLRANEEGDIDATTIEPVETIEERVTAERETTEDVTIEEKITEEVATTDGNTAEEITPEESTTEQVLETTELTEEATVEITTVKEKDENVDEKDVGKVFLRRLKEEYRKVIDPFPIPDRDFKYEQSIIFTKLKFQYKLYNCKLHGLLNLYELRKFAVTENGNRDTRILTGQLAVDELKTSCDVFIQVLPFTRRSVLHGFARDLIVDVEMEHNKKTGRLRMTQFQVEEVKDLYYSLNEGGLIKYVANTIIKTASRFFKGVLTTFFNIEIAYIARAIASHIIIQE